MSDKVVLKIILGPKSIAAFPYMSIGFVILVVNIVSLK